MALDDRGYYNVSQAAALLGVSRVSIWRWIRDGHLPAVRLGQRTTRIKRDDLERALSQITATGSRSWVTRNKAATPETGCASLEPSDRGKWGASEHVVQFYEKDAFLEAAVADYIGAALRGGDAGIVISTRTHLENIEADLRSSGFDLDAARASGQYFSLDAASTVASFSSGEELDAECLVDLVVDLMARTERNGRGVRIFGEMVALLVAAGRYAAAIRLEELWNELQQRLGFVLLCAYPIGRLGDDALAGVLEDVCAAHTRLIPAESYSTLATDQDRLKAIVKLQQRAHWLQAETAERQTDNERLRLTLDNEQAAR